MPSPSRSPLTRLMHVLRDEDPQRNGPRVPPIPSLGLVVLWVAVVIVFLALFYRYDYQAGVQRGYLLVGLGAACLLFTLVLGAVRLRLPSARWAGFLFLGVAVVFGFSHLESGLGSVHAHWDGSDPISDQAQNVYRAIRLLEKGVNPYGYDTFLDPDEWHINGPWMYLNELCLPDWDYEAADARMREFWRTLSIETMRTIVPELPDTPDCAEWDRRFHSLGYKYGPFLMAAYYPFVAAVGQGGILLANLVFVVAGVTGFVLWLRTKTRRLLLLCLPLAVLLGNVHLRDGGLVYGHSDVLPTVLAGLFLVLWIEKKHRWSAVVLGCCVASKTFPGMIFAPLLLRRPRDLPLFAAPIAICYLPFLVWDWRGLWYNFSYPLFYVRYDPWSVGYLYSEPKRQLITLICVGTSALFLFTAFLSRWNTRVVLIYLVATHLAVCCSGRMFHNNYLMWLAAPLPLLVFWTVWRSDAAGDAGGEAAPASARA